ncbi:MAG TPA: GNAT family N-acetyltransferase [Ilumatobacter sp.]
MVWIDEPIETGRLRLRSFRSSDQPTILRLLADPEVRRYLGGPVDDDHLEAARTATVGERWGVFCVAESVSDVAIGGCSFDRWRGVLELTYEMLPEYWGRGLAAEAVAAALGWMWTNTDDDVVVAVTQTANLASRRLLERLGFEADLEFEEFGAAQSQLRLCRPAGVSRDGGGSRR